MEYNLSTKLNTNVLKTNQFSYCNLNTFNMSVIVSSCY